MDGILNINKAAGLTSHDVVARVRRLLRTKRAGHAGTLDPDATGVLVVAVGAATRLLPHLDLEPKRYTARITWGIATTTEDASGTVTDQADASALTEAAVRAVLPQFLGEISQIPPMVSALHHQGQRLYDLARQGITVERNARTVTIHDLALSDFTPGQQASATLAVTCGGGTYIRTLCKDIGLAVALPAHMATLRRDAVGPFTLASAHTLETIGEQSAGVLLPMEAALPCPTVAATDHDHALLLNGRAIPSPRVFPDNATITILYRERLSALACFTNGELRPFKVFPASADPA